MKAFKYWSRKQSFKVWHNFVDKKVDVNNKARKLISLNWFNFVVCNDTETIACTAEAREIVEKRNL